MQVDFKAWVRRWERRMLPMIVMLIVMIIIGIIIIIMSVGGGADAGGDHLLAMSAVVPVVQGASAPRRPGSFAGRLKALIFKLLTLPFLLIIYLTLLSAGAKSLMPGLSVKLHRLALPFVHRLREYEGFDRLDISHVFAIFLCLAVFFSLNRLMWVWLCPRELFERANWDPVTYTRFIVCLSIALLIVDSVLFYCGLVYEVGGIFGGSLFSLPALIGTLAYNGVLLFLSFVNLNLERS